MSQKLRYRPPQISRILRRKNRNPLRKGSPSFLGGALHKRQQRKRHCILFRVQPEMLFLPELPDQPEAEIFLSLQDQGAHNINLVTASHFLPGVLSALDLARPELHIPVVYNSGGYEKPEIIELLKGYVDIYLPDLKYYDPRISARYSNAENYFQTASQAISAMIAQTGKPEFDQEGMMAKGVIIRHMVLPGCRKDSSALLRWMKEKLPEGSFLLSLLSQYTPFYKSSQYPEIHRRLTSYEYDKVLDEAISLGLTQGFMQEKSSAKEEYTPPFNFEGL